MKDSFYTAEQQKVRMRDKKVQSVQEINFDNLVLPIIAVHKNPDDYPDHCTARIFDMQIPTHVVMMKESLQEIMEDIEEHTDMVFLNREVTDASSLIGIYL